MTNGASSSPRREPVFQPLRPVFGNKRALLGAAALLLVGAALRLYGLGIQSLWFDELCSWHTSHYATAREVMLRDRAWHFHPPAYHLLLHYAMPLLGDSEVALRLPSALAGIASILLVYLLGCRVYSYREGLVAAAFTAVCIFPVYYAQEARPYALLLCCSLLTTLAWTYAFERLYTRERPGACALAGYALGAIACCYLHYFGLLYVGCLGLLSLACLIGRWRSFVVALLVQLGIAAAYLPWLPSLWMQLLQTRVAHPPPEGNVLQAFFYFVFDLFNHGLAYTGPALAVAWAALGLIAVALAAEARAYSRAGRDTSRRGAIAIRTAFLLVSLLMPFAISYAKSVASPSVFTYRNLIVSMPAAYLLVAAGIMRLPGPGALRGAVAALAIGLAFGGLVFGSGYYTTVHKDQFREAVAVVVENEAITAPSLIAGCGYNRSAFDYYFKRLGSERRIEFWGGKTGDIEALARVVDETRPAYLWYLSADPYPDNAFLDYLAKELRIERATRLYHVDVFLIRNPAVALAPVPVNAG